MILWFDCETRSTVNLPTAGLHVYAPKSEIILSQWAIDDGPVIVEESITPKFLDAFVHADMIIAHNAEFDRTCLHEHMKRHASASRKYAPVAVDIRWDRWYCTAAQARRHGLPGGLGVLCDILKVPTDKAKDKRGRELIMLFCKPRPDGTWADKSTHPEQWAEFKTYGGLDIHAMRAIHKLMPTWNDERERAVWLADQRVNARGFCVDRQFAQAAVAALGEESDANDAEVSALTNGELASARQVEALLAHILAEHGVDLPDMTAATLERRLADPDLPDGVRELLALRQQSSRSSTSKYRTLLRRTCPDGRLRGSITYGGAWRTLRWSGNGFQPHNLPRPRVGSLRGAALKDTIRNGIAAVKANVYDLVGTHPLPELLSSAVRGCLIPEPGKLLTIGDYANVEGRGLAWLAGETWKLQAYREYDAGTGPDLYKVAFSSSFGVPVDEVDDGNERQIGKVQELMLGYGGGVGAFVTGAATYKIELDPLPAVVWPRVPADVRQETARMWSWAVKQKRTFGLSEEVFRTCDAIKRLWRHRHPAIERFWQDCEEAFKRAIAGITTQVGMLTFSKKGSWVRVLGPAGRYLCYPGAHMRGETICYMGQNPYTKQWGRVSTYGGKIVENIVQWLCRCLLADSLVVADEWGLPVVLHVHDEFIVEHATSEQAAQEQLRRVMLSPGQSWAKDFPLAVSTFTTDRYHKD